METTSADNQYRRATEFSLLVHCCRTRVDPQAIERCAERVDWRALVNLARWHGVSPLVAFNLSHCGLPPSAAEGVSELRGDLERNAFDATRLLMELAGTIRLLADRGIRSVPFKGAALAESAYGKVWLRQFSDLDLLVEPDTVLAAKEALVERGYASKPGISALQEAVHVLRSPFAYSFTLLREGGPMAIDLHWRVAEAGHPAFPRRLNEPWDRLIEATLGGAPVKLFGPVDTLLLISAHAAKHGWSRLRWICDIAEVLRSQPDIDWVDALSCASGSGPIGERTLLTSAGLAARLYQSTLPPEVGALIAADRAVQALLNETVATSRRKTPNLSPAFSTATPEASGSNEHVYYRSFRPFYAIMDHDRTATPPTIALRAPLP